MKVENLGSHKIWSTFEYQIPIEFVLKKGVNKPLFQKEETTSLEMRGFQFFSIQVKIVWGEGHSPRD